MPRAPELTITDRTLLSLNRSTIEPGLLSQWCRLLFDTGLQGIALPAPMAKALPDLPSLGNAPVGILTRDTSGLLYLQPDPYTEVHAGEALPKGKRLRFMGFDDLLARANTTDLGDMAATGGEFCPGNRCHCATALAIEWLSYSGGTLGAAFGGAGGHAAWEAIIMAKTLAGEVGKGYELTFIPAIRETYEALAGTLLSPYKPVSGRDIFMVESGIHVDGILKDTTLYEPYDPALVGNHRHILMGETSGRSGLKHLLETYGLPRDALGPLLLERIKNQCAKKGRALTKRELVALVGACHG